MSLKDAVKKAKKDKIEKQERASEKWTATKIRDLLAKSDVFVERALCVLLARQTDTEVQAETVNQHNNMGFTSTDAKFLTSLAKQIQRNEYTNIAGKRLSYRQRACARKRLMKYARQLARYANTKEVARAAQVLGVMGHDDFVKGGTYRKVDYGETSEKENKNGPTESIGEGS